MMVRAGGGAADRGAGHGKGVQELAEQDSQQAPGLHTAGVPGQGDHTRAAGHQLKPLTWI